MFEKHRCNEMIKKDYLKNKFRSSIDVLHSKITRCIVLTDMGWQLDDGAGYGPVVTQCMFCNQELDEQNQVTIG
jgi:hypothetical protein